MLRNRKHYMNAAIVMALLMNPAYAAINLGDPVGGQLGLEPTQVHERPKNYAFEERNDPFVAYTVEFECACAGAGGHSSAGGTAGGIAGAAGGAVAGGAVGSVVGPTGTTAGSAAGAALGQIVGNEIGHHIGNGDVAQAYGEANDTHQRVTGKPLLGPGPK